MEELNVKVGDKVIRCTWCNREVCEVAKVTPSGMVDIKLGAGTERFSKSGRRTGANSRFDHVHIRVPKDGEIEKIKQEREFERKRSCIRNYPLQNLPLEALRELVDVIEKYEKKQEESWRNIINSIIQQDM